MMRPFLTLAAACLTIPLAASNLVVGRSRAEVPATVARPAPQSADDAVQARRREDVAAMQAFRPGYPFWRHVFMIPDGSIAFGSAVDGRLLATLPARRWSPKAFFTDPAIARVLDDRSLARPWDGREQVALRMGRAAGPVAAQLDPRRCAAHERAEIRRLPRGVGRHLRAVRRARGYRPGPGRLESGLSGTRRSNADAVGFCQWQRKNWKRLGYFSRLPIQERNQTTQAPYCAAYLSVLAAKYGSFIPALSEHNAGGTNVGRTLITGEHLGGRDVRARYLVGSQFARDLRTLPSRGYEDVYGSYGVRSYLYAEMVFGNTFNVSSWSHRRLSCRSTPCAHRARSRWARS